MPRTCPLMVLLLALTVPAGCRNYRGANVELRRENQKMRLELERLGRENAQLRADILRHEQDRDLLPTLSQERLEQLWTVADLRFGRMTGIDRRAEGQPLKVHLRPVDRRGDTLKAAGSITIDAFDLDAEEVRLGQWQFPVEQIKRHWVSLGLVNEYVLTCPWESQPPPQGKRILVRATFHDALTQRTFRARTDAQ